VQDPQDQILLAAGQMMQFGVVRKIMVHRQQNVRYICPAYPTKIVYHSTCRNHFVVHLAVTVHITKLTITEFSPPPVA
jgi:hypothetical protein